MQAIKKKGKTEVNSEFSTRDVEIGAGLPFKDRNCVQAPPLTKQRARTKIAWTHKGECGHKETSWGGGRGGIGVLCEPTQPKQEHRRP